MVTFEKLVHLTKSHVCVQVAERIYKELPAKSHIRSIPKKELCGAYLPKGVCTHGNTTNGMAESFNGMVMHVRHQDTPFKSLQAMVEFLATRNAALPKMCDDAGNAMEPSVVQSMYAKEKSKAIVMQQPQTLSVDGSSKTIYHVQSDTGMGKWAVSVNDFVQGDYEEACTAGCIASRMPVCKHFQRVILSSEKADMKNYRKPWQVSLCSRSLCSRSRCSTNMHACQCFLFVSDTLFHRLRMHGGFNVVAVS